MKQEVYLEFSLLWEKVFEQWPGPPQHPIKVRRAQFTPRHFHSLAPLLTTPHQEVNPNEKRLNMSCPHRLSRRKEGLSRHLPRKWERGLFRSRDLNGRNLRENCRRRRLWRILNLVVRHISVHRCRKHYQQLCPSQQALAIFILRHCN